LVNDTSFLPLLEQRTQQVKITLANLESEKARIETQIAALQPLIPHYDALIEAERALALANVTLEDAPPAGAAEPVPAQYAWNTPAAPGDRPAQNWGS